jgi:Na+/H+ antiporter NhaD/arsenite permease-like protein
VPILIFAASYLALALGRLPGLRVDRTCAAIIGASLMIATKVLTVQEAYNAINYETIMLLYAAVRHEVVANPDMAPDSAAAAT